jgi:sulfate transport system ATP-binding protein
MEADGSRRVQVLFRPEDVAVRDAAADLACPVLGEAVVDQRSFIGSFERLRLRLPPLPGVRTIAPIVPFGADTIWIEASRSQDQARRFPLQPGDSTWVGVQRVHALVHPGMRFLLPLDGSPSSQAALALGGQLARLAHARVTVLACGQQNGQAEGQAEGRLQEIREKLGSGLAALDARATPLPTPAAVAAEWQRLPADLVLLGLPAGAPRDGLALAERILMAGGHHLMMVPGAATEPHIPTRVLICVAVGEPGKEDVAFAGRLVRHLGAEATVLTVLPESERGSEGGIRSGGAVGAARPAASAAERFLTGSARTLWRQGVPASTSIRYGAVREQILAEIAEGGHDLLVLGAPLPDKDGGISLDGLPARLLPDLGERPVLIVRSREVAS